MRTKVVSLKHPFSHVLLCVRQEPEGCWRFDWWKAAIGHAIPEEPPEKTLSKAFLYPELAADYFTDVLNRPEDFQSIEHHPVPDLMPPAPECNFYWPPPLEQCIEHYEADLTKQPRHQIPVHRVIILGAGFSAAFQFATADKIIHGVMSFFENWHPSEWYQDQYAMVLWWLDSKFPAWRKSPPSLYEFLRSFIKPRSKQVLNRFVKASNPLSLFNRGISWESENCHQWITEHTHWPVEQGFLKYLFSFNALLASYLLIGFFSHKVALPWAVEFFQQQLSPNDVILTFNWDVIPEFLMTTHNIPFCRHDWTSERIKLIKLHGSIDLFGIPNLVMRADLQVKSERFECITDMLWRARTSEDVLVRTNIYPFGRALEPCERYNKTAALVITPSDLAVYAYRPIQFNWRKAQTALQRAREVYVIGYSMPEEDMAFRSLAKTVSHRWNSDVTVDVWNPDPLVGETAAQIFGKQHVAFHQACASSFCFR
jgi:hypothetical protein